MNKYDINTIVRDNIKKLIPYSSARADFNGDASIFLDANENNFGATEDKRYHRYPDPFQQQLKKGISELKGVPTMKIFVGNGSDEPVDLLIRAFCAPGRDNILVFPPTYGMYAVAANINDVEVREVPLTAEFSLDIAEALKQLGRHTKLIFICSPNNPTGNLMAEKDIMALLKNFNGLVVIDEAYLDFSGAGSWAGKLSMYPNLVVLQTFSKAWGLAGLRIGTAFASEEIINILNKIKPPYNISEAAQQIVLKALLNKQKVDAWVDIIISQREMLKKALQPFPFVEKIYHSDANFLLVKVADAENLYGYLAQKGIIVRNRTNIPGCENCLRITIGTPNENQTLLKTLNNYEDAKDTFY